MVRSQRPAKGTGARLQEADAMNNPWVWGPSDNDWLKGKIPEPWLPYGSIWFLTTQKIRVSRRYETNSGETNMRCIAMLQTESMWKQQILGGWGMLDADDAVPPRGAACSQYIASLQGGGENLQVLDRGPCPVGWYRLMEIGEWFGPSKHPDFHACPEWFGPNSWIYISRHISIYFPDISSGCMFLLGRKRRLKPPIFWGSRSEAGCTATSKVTVFNTTTEEVERCRCSLTRLTRLLFLLNSLT